MEKKRHVTFLNYLMLAINWFTVMVVTGFICVTTNSICDHYIARDFVNSVSALPWKPDLIMVFAGLMMTLLTFSFIIREYIYRQNASVEIGTLIFDFIVSMLLVMLLNFNYNGILLWTFANMVFHNKRSSGQFFFMLLAILSYVGTDYGLVSINVNLFNIQDYINYYDSGTQAYLLGIFNVLVSLNIVFFIAFCVFVIREQQGTIDEVNELYAKLSKANEDLQAANTELHKFAMMKEKMGETKERNRLAREIHDTLGHTLTGISAGLDACLAIIDVAPDKTKQQLEIISEVTRDGIKEVRRSVSELRPDSLERLSLEYAIRKMVKDTNSMTNTKVNFDCQVEHLRFDEDEENAIYRVIQESVTNAIRHGHATVIDIVMKRVDGEIHLTIKDNGGGCEEMKPGFGTRHIKERIEMLNGSVEFDGSDGFLVDATIPIRWGEEYD